MMTKLYWRVKLNDKWTWRPVQDIIHLRAKGILIPYGSQWQSMEEEE